MAEPISTWLRGKPWTYWETLTFEWDVSPATARRAVEKYNRKWCPDRAVWVVEHGRVGGRTHLHQLSFYRSAPDSSDLWQWWHARYGRAQIVPHDSGKGGVGYLLKSMDGAREDHIRRGCDWDVVSAGGSMLESFGEVPF